MKRIALAVMLVSANFFISGCGINGNPGTGEKIGSVVRVSQQGVIVKTWEGQLIRGGMSGGNGSFGTVPFDFTIENEEMAKKTQEYMENQTEVLIKYRTEFMYSLTRSDSGGDFLTSIEPVKK